MAPNPYIKAVTGTNGKSTIKKAKKLKSTKTTQAQVAPAVASKATSDPTQDALRREVLALGGDEEELKMLLDVDSESEIDNDDDVAGSGAKPGQGKGKGKDVVDPALSKELHSLFKTLDFASVSGVAAAEEEDDVAEDEEGDDESDENGDEDGGEEDSSSAEDEDSDVDETVAPEPEVKSSTAVQSKAAAESASATAKKESKYEREERRKAEREAKKEREKADKLAEREAKQTAVKTPTIKSPWLVDPTPQWYAVPLATIQPSTTKLSRETITALAARGEALLTRENELYSSSLSPSSRGSAPPPPNGLSKADQVFIQQILTSGTSSDKVSALLLLVSSSPLHTMAYLEQLATLCKKKSRDESGRAVRGIVEWWRGDGGEGGGSPSRKLRTFADQPLLSAVAQALDASESGKKNASLPQGVTKQDIERTLALFAFEDWLKKWFFSILQALEQMSMDSLPHPRSLAVVHLANLLRDKPEQEGNLLRLLVNKLGDSQRGIASKTSHHLLQILQVHPGMTPIMVREVSGLILRPNTSAAAPAADSSKKHFRFDSGDKTAAAPTVKSKAKDNGHDHARYYGVITLNQIMLKKDQSEVAGRMIEVYFAIFGDVLGRVRADDEEGAEGDAKTKPPLGEKRKRGAKGKEAAVVQSEGEVDETDSKVIAAVLTGVNRAFPFAKIDDDAFKKRLDTLFRITHSGTFNVSIQALLLIYHVSAAKKAVSDRFYRALYASLYDHRLAESNKHALYLNLVFKALKQDPNRERVMAVIKRLVQLVLLMDVTFILGALFIVGEMMVTTPGLRKMLTEPEDLPRKLEEAKKTSQSETAPTLESIAYDGKKREPQFAHAENSCLWELVPLLNHFHPTVALHASMVLSGEPLSASDELEQYSLAHFLDRFVYRDAKKTASTKGASMMQPGLAGQDKSGRIMMRKGTGVAEVNSDKFKRLNKHSVPVDQLFFHTYFTQKASLDAIKSSLSSKRKSKPSRGSDSEEANDSDNESINDLGFSDIGDDDDDDQVEALGRAMDEEDQKLVDLDDADSEMEEEIWKAMKASLPRRDEEDATSEGLDEDDDEDGYEDDDDDDEDTKAPAIDIDSHSELGVDEDFDMDEVERGQRAVFVAAADSDDGEDDDGEERDEEMFASEDDEEADEGAEKAASVDEGEDAPFKSAFDYLSADEDDDDLGLAEDEDDLIGSDEDAPELLPPPSKKQKKDERKLKRQKVKNMPMFATAEDYAHLLGDSDDDGN
ncbi:BQ2448_754 [Microbotryum intermedium]|uniref:BQ2448_754 protein n=1 Tax=Microbotryum intermedium TaxID=269621 RepID=A0A238F9D9_9BASI|nr:BQ2448_754 [Microbotryum intermedium]